MSLLKTQVFKVTILSIIIILLGVSAVFAQAVNGNISGIVKDQTGAIVPGAEITAKQAVTGEIRKVVSNSNGAYLLSSMPIGNYEITANMRGFKKAVFNNIELHISDHLGLNIVLEIGSTSEEIVVVGESMQLNTETSDQGGLISGEQIQELQLNGRSFMTLLELLPGIASNMPDRADPNTAPALYVNGARSTASNFSIDGGNNSDVIVGSSSLNTFTSIDTIAEVKVITSTFAAEYGRSGASQVNVVTKGGGKKFHGSAYEFFRNDYLDARDYLTHEVMPLKLNNFGYSFSGPVILPWRYNRDRNKTFFFFTQEFNRITSRNGAVNTRVPTEAERRGDFSALGPGADRKFQTADDPVIDPNTKKGFKDGIIPSNRLDQNALKLIALYPLPNIKIGNSNLNYTSAQPTRQRWREEVLRIDHTITDKHKIFGRYTQDTATYHNPYGGSSATSTDSLIPGISTTLAERPGKNIVLNYISILSPSLLSEASITYSSRKLTRTPLNNIADRDTLGLTIPEVFPENHFNLFPTIALGSNYASVVVSRQYLKKLFNFEFSDNVTWTKGKHIFKFGGYYTYGGNRENSTASTNGSFLFNTGFTKNPVANFLLGLPVSYTENEKMVVTHTRFAAVEAFVQDDVKLKSNFTINIGVRYTGYFNPWDVDNVSSNFDPARWDPAKAPKVNKSTGRIIPGSEDPLNGLILANVNSPFGKKVTKDNTDLWGPRVGFAWTPFGSTKTVVRSGYGIYYSRPMIGTYINNAFDNLPNSKAITYYDTTLTNPTIRGEGLASPNLTALDLDMKAATIQQWSLGIQRELRRSTILNISYVGSSGAHLMRPVNINTPTPNPLIVTSSGTLNSFRPYLGWGNITVRESSASSNYNSLQVKFDQRFRKKFNLGVAYTWSKSIDNGSSERDGSDIPPDRLNKDNERAVSDFDRTHIFTTNFIWYLPKFVKGGLSGSLLNGWELSGIGRMWTGTPFDVALSVDVAGIGPVQNQRPDLIADTEGPKTADQYFNVYAFARPKTGTYGNMGRNSLRTQGVNKWDLALYKNFRVKEKVNMQFRAEAFNVFNHPIFTNFGRIINTSGTSVNPVTVDSLTGEITARDNFGVVTSTRDSRVLQFALKLNF